MPKAISLWFKESDEDQIRFIWKLYHDEGLSSFLWTGNFRPHITLAVCEDFQVDKFKKELITLLSKQKKFNVHFSFVGCFLGNEDVDTQHTLFLGVTPNLELLNLHRKVYERLSNYGIKTSSYYQLENWNPHCSILRDVTMKQVSEGKSLIKNLSFPIVCEVERVGIIETPDEIELDYVPLVT